MTIKRTPLGKARVRNTVCSAAHPSHAASSWPTFLALSDRYFCFSRSSPRGPVPGMKCGCRLRLCTYMTVDTLKASRSSSMALDCKGGCGRAKGTDVRITNGLVLSISKRDRTI